MAALGFESNSDLARASGVPDSAISRWRTSGTIPSVAQLRRLQALLQAPLLELLVAAGHLDASEARLTTLSQPVRSPRSTREAIRIDPYLTDDLKQLLIAQYEAMLALADARQSAHQ
jgi:transcriptional regulator with XRE-family HTH domain